MRVTILGAGTTIPAKDRSPAGIYVRAGSEHVLLDAGPGTLQRLNAIDVSPFDVDRVFLTHFHLDHCLELATLLFARRIPRPGRLRPLAVYGPPGLRQLYRRLNLAFHHWLEPRASRVTLTELGEQTVRCRGYTVTSLRMRHSAPALGYRLAAAGARMAYSGDTDICPNVVELGASTDLFILECSLPDARKAAGHLTPSECGRIAASARCRHLVLTHFYPVFRPGEIGPAVRRAFAGRLTLAKDFTTVTVEKTR